MNDRWAGRPQLDLQDPWEAISGVLLCLKEVCMRPETSVLLYLEPMSAIMARVAYRVIQRDFKIRAPDYVTPGAALSRLSRQLQRDGFPGLSLWVAAYAFHYSRGDSTASTKQRIVRRARWAALNREKGKPWARVPPR